MNLQIFRRKLIFHFKPSFCPAIMHLPFILCCFFFLFQNFHCLVVYNITSSTPLRANQTLVSISQAFEFGFFTPDETTGNQYAGIRFKNLSPPKIVWVANREKPMMSYNRELASLKIDTDGDLKLVDGQANTIWSTNRTIYSSNSFVELLDNGNLVYKDINSGIVLWESFDYPCDTLLPGMKIGIDVITGEKKYLVSWKNDSSPSPGSFIFGITPEVPPQAITWKGSLPYWRGGQWDKVKFVGMQYMTETYEAFLIVQQDAQGTYVTMRENSETSIWLLFLSSKGLLKLLHRDYKKKIGWNCEAPVYPCQLYGACGPFGICSVFSSPICSCLTGFVPKSFEEWNRGNRTSGCIRKTTLSCERSTTNATSEDVFRKVSTLKLPDSAKYIPDPADAQQCRKWCLSNCSCQAYSFIDSVGCMIWTEPLMDMEKFNSSGSDLFIRLAPIDSGGANQKRIIIITLTPVAIAIVGLVAYGQCKRKAKQKGKRSALQNFFAPDNMADKQGELQQGNMWRQQLEYDNKSELPLFSFTTILAATNNFSVTQKLGQGGFGPVYKGKLDDGRDVAIKRLSSSSEQGMQEFKNEILLISKLQHRNLVKLVGCCIHGEEKILVYEYLPNKSLDRYVFDSTRKIELDWNKRFNIIQGVARGLMYLHSDSCLRVIHRDLKTSNILLDEKMNPKISDFGLARMFQGTQVFVNTRKVVGTLGYMSPEYALGGMFSEKLDVYSFGVLILETISGKKNSTFYCEVEDLDLLSYAWQLWSQGKGLELMDETLVAKSPKSEVMKCIHVGLLCVQDHTNDRPNTASIVLMLGGDSDLPQPKQPTFAYQRLTTCETRWHEDNIWTSNAITNSLVKGR